MNQYRSQTLPLRIRPLGFRKELLIFKRDSVIIQIQIKERIPRIQALRKLIRLNPNPELIYSNAVKNTSNQTRSKSPTRSEQESQSDSGEDKKMALKFYEKFESERENSPTVPTNGHGYYTKKKSKK